MSEPHPADTAASCRFHNLPLCPECGKCPTSHDPGCSSNRNSPESLEQRLSRAQEKLADALNLIGAMQPVVSAVERYFDNHTDGHGTYYGDIEGITGIGLALASYRRQKSKIIHEAHPQARRAANG